MLKFGFWPRYLQSGTLSEQCSLRNTYHVPALLSGGGLNQVLIAVHYQVRDKWRDRGESASGERRGELQVGRAGKIVQHSYLSHFQERFSSIRNFYVLQIWFSF